MTWSREIKVEIAGTDVSSDAIDAVEVSMGTQTPWEQSTNGQARISLIAESPDVQIGDQVVVSVESPDTPEATGGTVTTVTDGGIRYRVHTFTTPGTHDFVVTSGGDVEYLIVGGGGGGGQNAGSDGGGGGGGGGVLSGDFAAAATTYPIVVGAGATGRANGENSTAFGLSAVGGGAGAAFNQANTSGGSGGGGCWSPQAGAAGTTGQGFSGGNGAGAPNYNAGGGGGAGGVGGSATSSGNSGNGGAGFLSSITGTAVGYGGGGGGGSKNRNGSTAGTATDGGGNGGNNAVGQNGTDGRGGGGGGSAGSGGATDGGDGIVIIRYRDTYQPVFTGTVANYGTLLFDFGPIWTIQATGPLTRAGRRNVTSTLTADTEGDRIAELAQLALAQQWRETPGTWAEQTRTWDGFAVDTSQIDQPGLYDLAAVTDLPVNVLDELDAAAFSGSGWLYETRDGVLGYGDSTRRENTPDDEYLTIPGSAVDRSS